ncbi:MAG: adenylate/guanylate cyclase domain-containing protein [Candidatus Methylacidiphilales bacterium]|nr:adenylate/guanylate cyclase domain-containing protein [Candidatus Methylacidiphilales bacterium]
MESSDVDQQSQIAEMEARLAALTSELDDVRILYESTLQHSTAIEDELQEQNTRISALLASMKKYMSPQLYDAIMGGKTEVKLSYKRQKLTIFFSDIVDFTRATDMLEAEILSELLNEYLDEMARIALEHGATIDKFIGDAVMIFFGDPEFISDQVHAERCVRMAVQMQGKISQLSENWKRKGAEFGLRVRMGINTGYCTVGNFGCENRMDYTIIGGQVNIAARLEGMAEPGTIAISGTTFSLVENIVDAVPLGKMEVRGVFHPVPAYKVLGINENQDGLTTRSLISISSNGFSLSPIIYHPAATPENDRAAIVRALRQALAQLEKG